jgi:hypothetical protein
MAYLKLSDLLAELSAASEYEDEHVLLNVAGRWTGIARVTVDESGTILIESED